MHNLTKKSENARPKTNNSSQHIYQILNIQPSNNYLHFHIKLGGDIGLLK